ncbi:MAG TPA: hypothetical protein VGB37_10870 [Candidatus Lokiarchaeia archaeon]
MDLDRVLDNFEKKPQHQQIRFIDLKNTDPEFNELYYPNGVEA